MRFFVKHDTLELPFSPYYPQLFQSIGKFGAKKCFTDHQIANTSQLFFAIKENFSNLFCFWTSRSEREFTRDYLINVAACFFACHDMFICICMPWCEYIRKSSLAVSIYFGQVFEFCRLINKSLLEWFLLKMCKYNKSVYLSAIFFFLDKLKKHKTKICNEIIK